MRRAFAAIEGGLGLVRCESGLEGLAGFFGRRHLEVCHLRFLLALCLHWFAAFSMGSQETLKDCVRGLEYGLHLGESVRFVGSFGYVCWLKVLEE